MSWEYEALFDVSRQGGGSLLDGGWDAEGQWKDIPTEIRVGRMGYRTRTISAGPRLEVEIYPIFGKEKTAKLRNARKNITPEAVQRLNEERSRRRVVQLADANFTDQDIHLTLTYRQAPKYDQAMKDVKNFLRAVKRRREKRGMSPLKYIYSIEGDEEGNRRRIHVHMLMSGGINREELEAIWAKGYANADRLQPNEHGLEEIARYITKQQKNRRKWCCSRNLKQPKQRTSDTKMSNARVKRLALDFPNEAKEIMEKLYPNYQHVQTSLRFSDVVDGAYIRCLMRRKTGGRQSEKLSVLEADRYHKRQIL
ncbi:MAG: hypothetical protein II008_22145 [Oscillospiraceae bacterium]|nr:hypothetical protein [Oscillospiraceae bacterium]